MADDKKLDSHSRRQMRRPNWWYAVTDYVNEFRFVKRRKLRVLLGQIGSEEKRLLKEHAEILGRLERIRKKKMRKMRELESLRIWK